MGGGCLFLEMILANFNFNPTDLDFGLSTSPPPDPSPLCEVSSPWATASCILPGNWSYTLASLSKIRNPQPAVGFRKYRLHESNGYSFVNFPTLLIIPECSEDIVLTGNLWSVRRSGWRTRDSLKRHTAGKPTTQVLCCTECRKSKGTEWLCIFHGCVYHIYRQLLTF